MAEGRSEDRPGEGGEIPGETPVEPEPAPPLTDPARPRGASWGAALWPALLLVLVLIGVALSPFWAPDLAPLLPWGETQSTADEDYNALAARVAAIEQRPAPASVDLDAVKSAVGASERRVEQLESKFNARLAEIENRPGPPGVDVAAINSIESALAQRVDKLEAAGAADRQAGAAVEAAQAATQKLEQRLGALEAQSSTRAAREGDELQKVQQEVVRLGKVTTDLGSQVPALERQVKSQSDAERTDAALALLLLQMREAVEQARPFPTEYSAFKALARDPDIMAAAEPLAGAAQNGVAGRGTLVKRLNELAGQIATAPEASAESDWGAEALSRLRGLVTIRRIDGKSQSGPEAAVSTAQTALARGDLEAAVTALGALTGANADAARPWLQMARERLAVEKALDHLQGVLAVRLGNVPAAAPARAPSEPAAKARAPS